jgi:hypothetical protein
MILVSGCDLEVINPSEIAEESLDDLSSVSGVVTGVISDFGIGIMESGGGGLYVAGAMLTDEVVNVGSWVGLRGLSNGESRDDWVESQLRWATPARARWVANRGIQRLGDLVPDPSRNPNMALVKLYAGFSNRVMGDNFCEAVRDGGPLENFTVYFDEADRHFTDAIAIAEAAQQAGTADTVSLRGSAGTLRTAAYAGRAQVRMMLAGLGKGSWNAAVADAAEVPVAFIHNYPFSTLGRNVNRWVDWGFSTGIREGSVWGTPFAEWGQNFSLPVAQRTGDARVVFEPMTGAFEKGRDARRPYWRQRKFTSQASAIPNVRGTEMRLIEGEAALVRGDWQTAIAKINEVRTFRNLTLTTANRLPMVSATNADQAWVLLMKERGIEMWLEGRRLPDLRRWAVTPGKGKVPFTVVRREGPNLENPASDPRVSVYDVQRMCIEVSENEKLSNPNLR